VSEQEIQEHNVNSYCCSRTAKTLEEISLSPGQSSSKTFATAGVQNSWKFSLRIF
jgi:hypothetical protein